MPNYGFLIDHRKCIGCHACSVACKSENAVPLGVSRTWVKYVETGTFPNTRRHFQVNRCNHCANPPCVRICPVTAMYQRADGIVEFDPAVCIGCKACLQACPYDAIYIDPETHSAAKCHFCAHRTDLGLKPACEVVCPTQAIVSGDLDDRSSTISQLIAREPVSVRKPEQGTAPKLFYIDADEATLTPTAPHTQGSFVWAEVATDQAHAIASASGYQREIIPLQANPPTTNDQRPTTNGEPGDKRQETRDEKQRSADNLQSAIYNLQSSTDHGPRTTDHGQPIRTPQAQGLGVGTSAIMTSGRVAGQMIQTGYNAQHTIPWHWPVPAYLVTKSIGSGAFMALALAAGLGLAALDRLFTAVALGVALLFLGVTTGLLVYDLEKPRLFLTILTRPQWKSWLTRGAFILIGFALLAGLWLLLELGALAGALDSGLTATLRVALAWIGFPAALAGAIYTAFLFAQAEGRDLWQSPLLPFHLAVQSLLAGAGALLALGLVLPPPAGMAALLGWLFGASLAIDLFLILAGEFGIAHASEVAARAAHAIRRGRYRRWFWGGSIALGHALPLALLGLAVALPTLGPLLLALAALAAIVGLYAFEYAFVMAPQEIPNS